MKVKSKQFIEFISELHNYVVSNPQFRKDTSSKSESVIQGELRPLIVQFLEKYFEHIVTNVHVFYFLLDSVDQFFPIFVK